VSRRAARSRHRPAARDPRARAPGPGVSHLEDRGPADRRGALSTIGPCRRSASSSASRFITADGSSIRELAGVPSGNAANQSLAEATVPPGGETAEHYHRISEEIYLFLSGMGTMRLDEREAPCAAATAW
jgi:mannose-6-phosphate isomerase-like protein (cupin superfamily)